MFRFFKILSKTIQIVDSLSVGYDSFRVNQTLDCVDGVGGSSNDEENNNNVVNDDDDNNIMLVIYRLLFRLTVLSADADAVLSRSAINTQHVFGPF